MTLSISRHKGILNKHLCISISFRKTECLFFCGDSNIKYRFDTNIKHRYRYKFHVMRLLMKPRYQEHSDPENNILENVSDILWKYIELTFSNTLCSITQYSSACPCFRDLQVGMLINVNSN